MTRQIESTLRRLGANGLTAAMGLFGRSTPAEAALDMCCYLSYPASDYNYCVAHASYIWVCGYGYYMRCNCCEAPGRSALTCYYG